MDTSLFFFINQGLQNQVLDFAMPFITKNPPLLFTAAAVPFLFRDWRKSLLVLVLCTLGLAFGDGSANILKHALERLRPCQALEGVRLLVGCGGSFSFPSSHTVNAFAVAAIFSHFFRRAAVPMFLVALLVAFSRVYVGVHYPSDVLTGALWGGITAGAVLILHAWSSERYREKPYTTVLFVSLIVLSLFRYYYILTGPLNLSPDEAHYWEWSRRLDLSYYSKGPAIAYLIALTTWLMGDTVFAVRFLAPIFLALSSVFMFKLAMKLFNDSKKAVAAALVFQFTPLFSAYGIVMTIDSPFIFIWTFALCIFWNAVSSDRPPAREQEFRETSYPACFVPHPCIFCWLLLGVIVGIGLLIKYTMALFYICAFLFIVFSKEQRVWLRRKEPYLAFILSLLVFSPVIFWNSAHDWVTFKHTAGQAHVVEGFKISIKYFFDFLGSQIGIITPLLFFVVIYGAVKNYINRQSSIVNRYLFWFWAPVLGFFVLKSLQGKVQANWAMPAYITAFIAAADFFFAKETIKKGTRILLTITFILAVLLTAVSHYPAVLDLPVKKDPTSRIRGWEELGVRAGEIYDSMASSKEDRVFIFSDKYQVSSELAFYMPGNPETYCVNLGRRMNQYDIWGGLNNLSGYDAIFVTIGNENFPDELKRAFGSYEREKFTVMEKDRTLREYIIFKCYGFKGLESRPAESY